MIKFKTEELETISDALLFYRHDVLGLDDGETSIKWERIVITMEKIIQLIEANENRNLDKILDDLHSHYSGDPKA